MQVKKCCCLHTLIQFFSIKLKLRSIGACCICESHHYTLQAQKRKKEQRSDEENSKLRGSRWRSKNVQRDNSVTKFVASSLLRIVSLVSAVSENCLENVLNSKSIPWENCETISQYSLPSNLFFYCYGSLETVFVFVFSCAKYPYLIQSFLHQSQSGTAPRAAEAKRSTSIKRTNERNEFPNKTKIVFLHWIRVRIRFNLVAPLVPTIKLLIGFRTVWNCLSFICHVFIFQIQIQCYW